MKITILDAAPGEEEELILKCRGIDDRLMRLLNQLKQGNTRLNVYKNGKIYLLDPEAVFYFESVDQRVFVYGKTEVFEIKSRLYELEKELQEKDFIRASKSVILNINKIKSLTPAFSGRLEALLENGERVIISRQYVSVLREKLGL